MIAPNRRLAPWLAAAAASGLALGALGRSRSAAPIADDPNRHTRLPQLDRTPRRRFYKGPDLSRAIAIADLRARAHRRLPRIAIEYLEGGAEDEATLARERAAFADWRFTPRTLVDVTGRSLKTAILGKPAPSPLIVAPTGLMGLLRPHGDCELAQGAVRRGVPFVQSTMSNATMEEVAASAPGLRHWWQLYVFGGDEVWQELLRRAEAAGCEALVLTTNAQIFGNREWSRRTRIRGTVPTPGVTIDAALHPKWLAAGLLTHGMPQFKNVLDFLPEDQRGFFESSDWIRAHQPKSLSWDTMAKIRDRWKKAFVLKGLLHLDDVRRAVDAGVDAVVLSSHGGRQMDWAVSPLDLLPRARELVGDKVELHMAGGVRRGTDVLKALALGADAVMAGRAPVYGLGAGGARGVERALQILHQEALDAMGLLGAVSVADLGPDYLMRLD